MKCGWVMVVALAAMLGLPVVGSGAEGEAVVYCDLTGVLARDLTREGVRRRVWDETQVAVALQGLVNRAGPRLFLRYVAAADDFWWEQMTQPGGWLAGRAVAKAASIEDLLERFREAYRGVVVWDERVAATSNLASTIAGCEGLLPVRFDPAEGSLYRQLVEGRRLEVKVRLLKEDGTPLFTGRGKIAGTQRESSGSAKNDAYRWLIEHYVKTGKTHPQVMGYYLDAFWHRSWRASGPVNHTLSNHDFVIARRGVVFDLNVWDDEACVDDPEQPAGTDAATLKELLRASYERFGGEGVIHVAGFVPWAYKYTRFGGAGGKHEEVATEWRYAEILSCFNAFMDADALGLGAMANASFFQHYPLAERYAQNPKPTRESLIERGVLDAKGRIVPRRYVAHYVGDYDAAAWLYRELPRMWRDPARGTTPLTWAFNPCLAVRFPLGMAWARERRTAMDWFVAGDSGAGYLNPGYLSEPRPHSGLASGLGAWERYCAEMYRRWDLSATGFVIDGFARGMEGAGLDAYARFSPDGIVAQKVARQGVHGRMPYLKMATDLRGTPAEAAKAIAQLTAGSAPRFVVCRSILQTPTWYAQVEKELGAMESIRVVDLYTLLWLVREYESNREAYVDRRYAGAGQVGARPGTSEGIEPAYALDGPVVEASHEGVRCWRISGGTEGRYLYFDVDDAFCAAGVGAVEIEVEFLDAGTGRVLLQYDSTDAKAAGGGAYKTHSTVVERGNSGRWRSVRFGVADARFAGSQNGGADWRLFSGGEGLLVRGVRVSRR